ncbi:hypothetical protein IFR05_016944 [Cadophora sp. M221]|nr:hypothetical protein IFR05_016944 [Cadophora sp. M221]
MPGIYSLWGSDGHPLSKSTLLDNCGATNLVNDRNLLEPGSFVRSDADDVVECGSSHLPILGRGTRVLKGALTGPDGDKFDLKLTDVSSTNTGRSGGNGPVKRGCRLLRVLPGEEKEKGMGVVVVFGDLAGFAGAMR